MAASDSSPLPVPPPAWICGRPDVEEARSGGRWRKLDLTYSIAGSLPGVSSGAFAGAVRRACDSWEAVSPLRFAQVATGGDIRITTGRIDGPGKVLAWSELPPGDDRPLTQRYDTGDDYARATGLEEVVCHELGHAIGLTHDGEDSGSLMAPYYRRGLKTPQKRDAERIQALYPERREAPAPTPTPTPTPAPETPAGSVVEIRIEYADGGQATLSCANARRITIPGYRVTRES